ncbi:hypothetical protein [Chiayiivirga flava]|uniref:Uncharacterized protein n=1 Tax=Chiayiivirga flava TaxID=659595 RepID=A0A7W8FZV6_9GAMM|nr:hypothetical protein [Chiayiivirga flava]MBB5207609.1 hypothetical protein [Chiayiivirga flava]
MSTIDDNALILHYYGDDETPQQRELVAQALRLSPDLRLRYARLRDLLDAAAHDVPAPPDAGFEQRLWQNFNARLASEKAPLPVGEGLGRGSGDVSHSSNAANLTRGSRPTPTAHTRRRPRLRLATAAATSVLLLLGAGFFAGRLSGPDPAPPLAHQPAVQTDPVLAARVLDAYVAAHLRQTEGVLLTALNSDSPDLAAGNADLAAALIDSNRLYTQAAQRAGNTRLAEFLRQMEPVLIELANPPRGDGIEVRDGLRDYVRESDLLFQVRATEGALATRNLRT